MKNQQISQSILELLQDGKSLVEAVDTILGSGTFHRIAGEVWEEMKKTANPQKQSAKQVWSAIRGKAHLYKTARWDSEFVTIVRVANPQLGIFEIRTQDGTIHYVGCECLTGYCL